VEEGFSSTGQGGVKSSRRGDLALLAKGKAFRYKRIVYGTSSREGCVSDLKGKDAPLLKGARFRKSGVKSMPSDERRLWQLAGERDCSGLARKDGN